ncbi:pilus assembly protein [Vibrio sp. T187]|uniref:TadE/TadG family type IV pilus assembly protein n=1 Tax=Vibrio TaxID=662 RepID=UPI0010C9F6C5|nr:MULTISPECIES: TadE family protein [Vibrio]MBW3698324.1 pilus assembly protein [Vibrio sp. T187]
MKRLSGITIIEFTLMSSFMMLILLAIVSFGHFMYSMQGVNEAVRAAARMASVCQIGDVGIKNYISSNSYISAIENENIEIDYLDGSGSVLVGPSSEDVRFVRARAVDLDYQFITILNFLGDSGLITLPSFETTIPSESLGLVPNDVDTDC